jgi:hypothetical protein
MFSMTRPGPGSAVDERLAVLEAERLAPVPRAAHAVAIDALDLVLVLDYLHDLTSPASLLTATGDVTEAWLRLDAAARPHARHQESGGHR